MDFLTNFEFNSENLLRLLIVGLILYLAYCVCFKKNIHEGMITYNEYQHQSSKSDISIPTTSWINTGYGYGHGSMNPADRLNDLIKEYGNPDVIDTRSGGQAIWYDRSLKATPYKRIEIRDEQIPHDKPKPHVDFLYSWYKVEIPDHLISGLHKISESILYDPLKKTMTARCHDMKANIVTHWIVKNYAQGKLLIDEAVGMYGPMIEEVFEDSSGNKAKQLESEL
tara:strand:+ start:1418 stop:2092 length:675 start_codon:yes stop_codon:yes gene_type:complete